MTMHPPLALLGLDHERLLHRGPIRDRHVELDRHRHADANGGIRIDVLGRGGELLRRVDGLEGVLQLRGLAVRVDGAGLHLVRRVVGQFSPGSEVQVLPSSEVVPGSVPPAPDHGDADEAALVRGDDNRLGDLHGSTTGRWETGQSVPR